MSFSVDNLNVSYGSHQILNQISFSSAQSDETDTSGSLIGLIGPNGSGKTTLLKAVCGIQVHTGCCYLGKVCLEDLTTRSLAKKISYIPQRSGIHISIPVLEVVLMGFHPQLRLLERPSQSMKEQAIFALQTVGIAHLQNQDYLALSEGEKQLCILARTLIQKTDLLVLDEPDSALDFHNKYCMINILKQLIIEYHKIALLCLHDPVLALAFCDQIILLKHGSISDILYPQSDELPVMERAFSELYGSIRLREFRNEQNRRELILMPSGEEELHAFQDSCIPV